MFFYIKTRKASTSEKPGQVFFPVEFASSGILQVGSRFVKLLSVHPVNYYLLNPAEQQAFEEALMDSVRSLDIPLQVFSTVRSVDVRMPSMQLKQISSLETPLRCRYALDLAGFLEATVQQRAFQTRGTYVIVWADTLQDLESYMYRAIEAFSRARVMLVPMDTAAVTDLLYEIFNRDAVFKPSLAVAEGALEKFVKGKGIVVDA